MPADPNVPAEETLSLREAAGQLLIRRPDLSGQRQQRKRARQVANAVGMRVTPVAVLAGWLGSNPEIDVRDIELLLDEQVERRKAALPPAERPRADRPQFRARVVLELGWERLRGRGAREILKVLQLVPGVPLPRRLVQLAARVGPGAVDDLLWSGFVRHDDEAELLSTPPDVLAFLGDQAKDEDDPEDRQLRFLLAMRRELAIADPADRGVDHACSTAFELSERTGQSGLAASIALRQAERLRRTGRTRDALAWIERGLHHAGEPSAQALQGLLVLEQALTKLALGSLSEARQLVDEAIARLEGQDGAQEALERALLTRLELDLSASELDRLNEDDGALTETLQERAKAMSASSSELGLGPLEAAARELSGRAAAAHAARVQGRWRLARGEISEAVLQLKEARREWDALDTQSDLDSAVFALSVAEALRAAGRFSEVDEPLEAARVASGGEMDRILRETLPVALHDLGVAAGDRGDRKLAATLLDEALMVSANRVPAGAPIRAQIAYTRGLLSLAEGELGPAQDQLTRAAEASSEGSVPDPAVVAAARAWALAREGAHRFVEAARSLASAEEKLAESRGPHAAATAHVRFLRRSIES